MNRYTVSVVLALLLSGCASTYDSADYGFYTVDLNNNNLCKGTESNGVMCYPLAMIEPSYHEFDIARAYQIKPDDMQWSTKDFISILLQPESSLYSAEKLSDTIYRIPKNHATDTAYYYIKYEHYRLYEIKGPISD